MPRNKEAAILDIGSKKISVLIGESGINNILKIKGKGEAEYAGFSDGEFLQPEKLQSVFRQAILQAQENVKYSIKKLYIGVPGEFSTVLVKDARLAFKAKRKVTEIDVQELYNSGELYQSEHYSLINRSPIFFILDDSRMVMEPVGMPSQTLSGNLSFVFAEIRFLNTIKDVLAGLGIEDFEFLSAPLAESLLLFEDRDKKSVLVDIGYLTTTVSMCQGDGLLFLKSFSAGGAYIASDLMECLQIPFDAAERLKEKLTLNLAAKDEKWIVSSNSGKTYEVQSETAIEVAAARIEQLAKMVKQCIKESTQSYPEYLPLHLTGGGISYIRGAKDILAMILDRNVEIISPQLIKSAGPQLSSSYGVLSLALKQSQDARKTFWSRIFG